MFTHITTAENLRYTGDWAPATTRIVTTEQYGRYLEEVKGMGTAEAIRFLNTFN